MYKYEKGIPEKTVAMLYATGFLAGAISASFAGQLADRFGRRRACHFYCLSYFLTGVSMATDNLVVLFAGRVFGGIATTLLFSVFEAWMITEYHAREINRSGLALSRVFANMTTLSGIIAISSGVVGEALVAKTGDRTWPFALSNICCSLASCVMHLTWPENHGETTETAESTSLTEARLRLLKIFKDGKILALGVASCCFEGSMYLFVFFWTAALQSARSKTGSEDNLPFGVIFSSFMCAMVAGSIIFSFYNIPHASEKASFVLKLVILLFCASLSGATILENEFLLFWALCLIEAAVGAYYPCMAYLKSEQIEDGIRGSVYSIMRLPLNLFVVIAHSLDQEGMSGVFQLRTHD